ncbi:MAG: copper amine oxidase N-terminal domain-containing protein [Armatimonadetes bacterium]|nr:copper amine oxidase N-terminal domain-containing protein [Armatimonadota bacterium]
MAVLLLLLACRSHAGFGTLQAVGGHVPYLRMALLALLLATPAHAQAIGVFVDGRPIEGSALVRDGITYFPVAPLARAMNLTVSWDPVERTLRVDGNPVAPDPVEQGGAFLVPLESVARAAGATVKWDAASRRVDVRTRGSSTTSSGTSWDPGLDSRLPSGWQFPDPHEASSTYPDLASYQAHATPGVQGRSPAKGADTDPEVFVPRSARDAIYSVTVTNVEKVGSLKGYYSPRGGYSFVIVYMSQKNMTAAPQVDPGRFHVEDDRGNRYPMMDDLSNFYPVIFRPYGINFGYQVYEVPTDARATGLVLSTSGHALLRVKL